MKKQPQRRGPGRPKSDNPSPSVSVRLKPDQLEQLDDLAKKNGTDRTALIQIAIARLLEKGL